MGTLFVAGVYGVGKSTLCDQLSHALQIPYFSASDLISKVNGEQYGSNKTVTDKYSNQDILVMETQRELQKSPRILLAGHFCIFTKENRVDRLPDSVFSRLSIKRLLLLDADTETIISNLSSRDKRQYTYQQILELQHAELTAANEIAKQIDCDLHIHTMRFDGTDHYECLSFLEKEDW